LDAIVIEDLLHFLEAVLLENTVEVGMPDAKTLETHAGGRLHTIFKVERTILPVGVRKAR
jgi:hypothetical protein